MTDDQLYRIKPLEWVKGRNFLGTSWRSTVGHEIYQFPSPGEWGAHPKHGGFCSDKEAKLACEKHHREELLKSLIPVSPADDPDEIKAAYKRGWNDREDDFMTRAARILPPENAAEARAWNEAIEAAADWHDRKAAEFDLEASAPIRDSFGARADARSHRSSAAAIRKLRKEA